MRYRTGKRTRLIALTLACALILSLVNVLPAAAVGEDFVGGPIVTDMPTQVPNDHTPLGIRFTAEGLVPDTPYEVKIRLAPNPEPSGSQNRGYTWNPTTGQWVRNRGPAWGEGNYPTQMTDADGNIVQSEWFFFKFANEMNSGMYYIIVTINRGGDGEAQNAISRPTVRVLDMKSEGVWLHNGSDAVDAGDNEKRVVVADGASTSSENLILGIMRSELNGVDDDSNGTVDDEVYGVPGGMGDYRMGVAATSTVDVYVQKSRVISDLALTANPDEDIALDAADMVAPSKPTSLTADYVGAGAVDLAWNPATDNTGVTAYHVYRWEEVSSVEFTPAHVRIATVTEPEFLDATTTPGATYRYEVRAVDAATNVGARSDWAEIYVNIPPVTEGEEYSLPRDTVLSVSAPGVLANDYNPDNAVALTAYVSSYAEHGIVAMDLDGGFTYTPDAGFVGTDDFSYIASDGVDESAPTQVSITVGPTMADGVIRVSGDNRYLTSVEASKKGFPYGAKTVVLATGENWPDALGGSALAGAVRGPLLLTKTAALPAEVLAEIGRLKADSVYILGSTAAVSADIENALKAELGAANVLRLGGANRYETAKKVADKTIELLGDDYTGNAFVATGLNFADAAAAAPLAAALGRPILLANINAGTVYVPGKTTEVDILGSPAAVPSSIETALNKLLGDADVERVGGINRYATAAMIAQLGVDEGMSWNGVGLATGLNFPDALSGGAMLSEFNSVLLLTRPDFLSGEAATKLSANKDSIDSLFIFGDTNAVSTVTEAAAKKAAGL